MIAPSRLRASPSRSRRGKRGIAEVDPDRPAVNESRTAHPRCGELELLAQVELCRTNTAQILEVKSLSAGGLIVATTDRSQIKAFTLDKKVTVAVFSTHHLRNTTVKGRIVWAKKHKSEYAFGIAIERLTKDQFGEIATLVDLAYRLSGKPPLLPFPS